MRIGEQTSPSARPTAQPGDPCSGQSAQQRGIQARRRAAYLDQVAQQLNSKPVGVALAWLIARPGITVPIASASDLEQLNDLIDATKLELDYSSLQLLDQASAY